MSHLLHLKFHALGRGARVLPAGRHFGSCKHQLAAEAPPILRALEPAGPPPAPAPTPRCKLTGPTRTAQLLAAAAGVTEWLGGLGELACLERRPRGGSRRTGRRPWPLAPRPAEKTHAVLTSLMSTRSEGRTRTSRSGNVAPMVAAIAQPPTPASRGTGRSGGAPLDRENVDGAEPARLGECRPNQRADVRASVRGF